MSKIKHFVEQSWLLLASSFLFGLLIAIANAVWSPRIEQNEKDKLDNLMKGLISQATTFEPALQDIQIALPKGKTIRTDIYKATDSSGKAAGFAFVGVGSGFADKIKLVIAIDSKAEKFYGFKVLASNETPGFGDRIKGDFLCDQFRNAPAGRVSLLKTGTAEKIDSEIVAISGATVSSDAVVKIFNNYIDAVKEQLQEKGLIGNDK